MASYAIQCHAGFFNPVKEGKHKITGFSATVSDTSAAARVKLVDGPGEILASTYDLKEGIIDVKGVAGQDGNLEQYINIKVREGLSAVRTDNVVPGSIKVFVE